MPTKIVKVSRKKWFLGWLIEKYQVEPAQTRLSKSATPTADTVRLVNATGKAATWTVPTGPLKDPPANEKVEPGQQSPVRDIAPGAPEKHPFEFQVFVDGKRAHANSDPIIIIDP